MTEIKWGIIQPLTGGMYYGAKQAIGHKAEWILSFPGFCDKIYDKEHNLINATNEYNLIQHLKKHNECPPYLIFNRQAFQQDNNINPEIIDFETHNSVVMDYVNKDKVDIVFAVPVCSGLSTATTMNEDTQYARNCNMLWIANYTLSVIQPKVYIFENAPTFMGSRGDFVREKLEEMASNNGYSVAYYKTDTRYHDNCQRRPRTFIYFFKNKEEGKSFIPKLNWERIEVKLEEFFERIPSDAVDNGILPLDQPDEVTLDYVKYRFGDNWREYVPADIFNFVIASEEEKTKFKEWLNTQTAKKREAFLKYIEHIENKQAQGKGFWGVTPKLAKDHMMPATMFKTMWALIHHKEDRHYSIREWLFTMGMPNDYIMYGEPINFFARIGQNVPARTAQFIASEAVRILNNWNNEESITENNTIYYNNIHQKIYE